MTDATASIRIPGLDLTDLADWMRSRGVAPTGPLRAERVGRGQSNLIYRVEDAAGSRWIVRRPPLGPLLASAHDIAREARVLTSLAGQHVPIPEVVGLLEPAEGASDEDAVPMLVMGFVDGVTVDSVAVGEQLTVAQRAALGTSMTETLAAVHAVDLDATGLSGLASHEPYAGRQLRRWSTQWERSRTRDLPVVDALARRLAAAAPDHEELTLVHGDFHLRNVIARPDGAICAVVDWELCTLGDPIADLGSLFAYWPEAGESALAEFSASALPGFPDRATLAADYLRRTGRDGAHLGFWHTFGLWKLAIIAEGVRRRDLKHAQNADGQVMSTKAIEDIIARAARTADEAGL